MKLPTIIDHLRLQSVGRRYHGATTSSVISSERGFPLWGDQDDVLIRIAWVPQHAGTADHGEGDRGGRACGSCRLKHIVRGTK
jgi:hypothetical protein